MSKYTPGPWSLRPEARRSYISIQDDDGNDVAHCFASPFITQSMSAANAHLIAAAPDMLAALETFVNNFERLTSTENLNKLTGGPLFAAYQAVRQAKGLP